MLEKVYTWNAGLYSIPFFPDTFIHDWTWLDNSMIHGMYMGGIWYVWSDIYINTQWGSIPTSHIKYFLHDMFVFNIVVIQIKVCEGVISMETIK